MTDTPTVDAPAAATPTAPERPVTQPELMELLNLIRPWQMLSDVKLRIGALGDGGYVMPGSSRRTNLVLSIGIGDETSFDFSAWRRWSACSTGVARGTRS